MRKSTVRLYLLTPESGADASDDRTLFWVFIYLFNYLFIYEGKMKKRRRKEEKNKIRRGR